MMTLSKIYQIKTFFKLTVRLTPSHPSAFSVPNNTQQHNSWVFGKTVYNVAGQI